MLLAPEGDGVWRRDFAGELLERLALVAVADDPEVEIGELACGEGGGADEGREVFDGGEAADEEEGEAGFWGSVGGGTGASGTMPL